MKRIYALYAVLFLFAFSALSAFAQHGQKLTVKVHPGKKLVLNMTNFPLDTLWGTPIPAYWRLVREATLRIEDFQRGTRTVTFKIGKLPDGEYYLANDYRISSENGAAFQHFYTYSVRIPFRIFTERNGRKTYKKVAIGALDSTGNFTRSWQREPRRIGELQAEMKQNTDTLVCAFPPASDTAAVLITDVQNLYIFERLLVLPGKTRAELDMSRLDASLYVIRFMMPNDDYYETLRFVMCESGRLVLRNPFDSF